jgi:hypothetical protein
MDIRAIETEYNGYRFRSRLEARWAVFFDSLGVKYEYEPEGFDLGNGIYYLPDFRVKCWGCRGYYERKHPFNLYIEVKGIMTLEDAEKINKFTGINEYDYSRGIGIKNPVLIVGGIPSFSGSHDSGVTEAYNMMDGIDIYPFNYQTIDGDYFAAYPAAHNGKFYLWGDDSNYINSEDIPDVERAYDAARKARFEHGEKPFIL